MDDFNLLAFSFDNPETGWDEGNFDSIEGTSVGDFNLLAFNFDKSAIPPTIAAVPEPTAWALLNLAVIARASMRPSRVGSQPWIAAPAID